MQFEADIGITIEGTYPFVKGGVSSWCHQLIESMPEYTFSLLTFTNQDSAPEPVYPVPKNVVSIHHKNLFQELETSIQGSFEFPAIQELSDWIHNQLDYSGFCKFVQVLHRHESPREELQKIFRNEDCHRLIEESYFLLDQANLSFIDFYWTIRSLLLGYLNALSYPSVPCRIYHSHATGYSGLLGAVQKVLNPRSPLLLTEHGIYTRERTMQLSFSTWPKMNMNSYLPSDGGGFYKKIWNDSFHLMSRLCYESCDEILSLYRDNNDVQIEEGADPAKVSFIHNGINTEQFHYRERQVDSQTPKIGFIGRITQIKNIKGLLTIARRVCRDLPGATFLLAGPTDEEKEYYEDCIAYQQALGLQEKVVFLGSMNAMEFYDQIDVLILTSLSEGQPLVLLEAGACGVPQVSVDVGGVREMILGDGLHDTIEPSGFVLPSWDEEGFAQAIVKLCQTPELYSRMAKAARVRSVEFYSYEKFLQSYKNLYERHLNESGS